MSSGEHLVVIAPDTEAERLLSLAREAGLRVTHLDLGAAAGAAEMAADVAIVWADRPRLGELVAALRAQPSGASRPIVAVGAGCEEVGADAAIGSPFDPEAVLRAAQTLLKRGRGPKRLDLAEEVSATIDEVLDKELRELTSVLLEGPIAAAPGSAPRGPGPTSRSAKEAGAFAHEVHETLSAIEQRLFPGTRAIVGTDRPMLEIDLDRLNLELIPVPDFDVALDEEEAPPAEPTQTQTQTQTPPRASPDEATQIIAAEPVVATAAAPEPEPEAPREALPAPAADPIPAAPSPSFDKTGDLARTGFADLLHRLARSRFAGRLRLRRAEAEKAIYFEEGVPIFATSSSPHDRLGNLLFREGKITRTQFDQCKSIVDESGRRTGAVLVDLGLLKPQELFPTVRRHIEDIVYSLFSWSSGTYELDTAFPEADQRVRLGHPPDAVVFEGVRRKLGIERLLERVGDRDALLEPRVADLAVALVDVPLTEAERQALALIDGRRTLGAVISDGPLDEIGVYQLAYVLLVLELARTEQAPRPASVLQDSTDRDRTIDRKRIVAKYAQVLEGDYFSLLGLRHDATEHEIQRAYEAAARDFSPESFAQELAAELGPELATIALLLKEAFDVLRDGATRSAYRSHLPEKADG